MEYILQGKASNGFSAVKGQTSMISSGSKRKPPTANAEMSRSKRHHIKDQEDETIPEED